MKTIIFSDLDGTFLNHHDYSFSESLEAVKILQEKQIPLIFTTSKTKIEVELLQKKVGIKEPFIIENGAALFIPKDYENFDLSTFEDFESYKLIKFGKNYAEILKFYDKYKLVYKMIGFSDMSIEEVAKHTSLGVEQATLSKQRLFTEPFILEDEKVLEDLKKEATKFDLKIVKGGRFFHLMASSQDKSIAVKKTVEIFSHLFNDSIKSMALGDGQNDADMLRSVDFPIVIQNHKGKYLDLDIENLQKSTYQGSKGFREMVLKNV